MFAFISLLNDLSVRSHTISSLTYNKGCDNMYFIALMLIHHTFTYKYIQSSCSQTTCPL